MRKLAIVVVAIGLMGMAYADLQNVQVGGLIEMRGRWIHNTYNEGLASVTPLTGGPPSKFAWDETNDWKFYEQTTSLNISADFTDHVSAFIEFYDYTVWGDDFRSNYLTGVDTRPTDTKSNVVVLQSYIETNEVLGQPLRLRTGRQCMSFGNKFLISDKTTPTQRLSFDAVRATYTPTKTVTIDAWVAKLAENSPADEDGDADFYGVYGTYAKSDAVNASLYYMLLRDARSRANLLTGLGVGKPTSLALVSDNDASLLNVIGARIWGKYQGFDYRAELAYEFGPADSEALTFAAVNNLAGVQPGNEHWDSLGLDGEMGYTFDFNWKPRLFVGGAHFDGGKIQKLGNGDIVMWPSFNRLFTDTNYCPVLQDNGDMSNFNQIRAGMVVNPMDKVSVTLRAQQLWADQAWPGSSNNLGFHLDTVVKYQYSQDLLLMLYYGHLFSGDALSEGNFVHSYGNAFDRGRDNDDADYAFLMLSLKI